MNLEILGISVLWTFLFGYIMVGAIDFGAGFFNAYSLITGKERVLTRVIQRYLSPVWEITNVFLVFFFVGIIGFFPKTAFYYGTTLLVPVSFGLILLAIRGSYYAFETYGARGHKGYSFMYGLAGLLIPASLSIVLTISEGGFIELVDGNPVLDYWKLFTSPLTWSIVVLSLSATLYISAVFLTWYANKARDTEAAALLRRYALTWALPTIIAAGGIIVELRRYQPEHYSNIQNFWPMFLISALLFAGTVFLLYTKRQYGWAFAMLAGQFAFAFYGYGASHYPYLLYPYLTIYDSFTNPAMAISLVVVFILGLCLLIPALYLVLRLFLFDKDYVRGKGDYHA
ncbi:cytochrome d ubiquinol oxidase subunit II [Sporosarcina trichiuri]|uniref:cytochrome d ubiquinol oxidase subunit II n=1 Tax=Sporosarcina trichiuri TaxID=3056445 RepID=UPI0025B287B7|nr:cytochrome d ubiquinol oxidase subunit II [Sporosarcina sp. 0.2-SM1T-5]WJY27413.1 cytochrome d ubiquinol oxidase subunit II [Sporosarcina sp. 0.2-SM1T-5]